MTITKHLSLAEAISRVEAHQREWPDAKCFERELPLLLAAARCHACDCDGGRTREGWKCEKCKADRELLAERG